MEKESSVCRPPPASFGVEDGWRDGRWPSEKARRRCREERERDDGEEERKGWCRNGVDELLSNILRSRAVSASLLSHERERGKGGEASSS
jgi:hypothetical protein